MSGTVPLKKFVTEAEIEDKRQKRQEEWEKVRQPHQPLEAPEEPAETRSLYEQLQAQKEQKQLEYEEQHKLRNQVRGLDKEETDFLDYVVERQQELENEKLAEENEVLQEFHSSIANRSIVVESSKRHDEKASGDKPAAALSKKRSSQAQLLAGAVKRKRSDDPTGDTQESKSGAQSAPDGSSCSSHEATTGGATRSANPPDISSAKEPDDASKANVGGVARVVGVLPGLGYYTDSENSDTSSSDSEIDTDIFRRDHGHKQVHDSGTANSGGHRHR